MNNPLELIQNPWNNTYWFARMLINNDKYGAPGKNNNVLKELTVSLKTVLNSSDNDETKINVIKSIISQTLIDKFKKSKSKEERIKLFIHDICNKINNVDDAAVFVLTMEDIVVPMNNALQLSPKDDKEFTIDIARKYLDTLGEKGLASVVNLWDDAGVEGCLNAERITVVSEYRRLRKQLCEMNEVNTDFILTAFVQEFERRLGQKRKSRAGGSLEDVADFLFDYFNITAAHKPEHFQADIEVDKWIKCKDKWLIGISCKRTLRERWKQVSSADYETLSQYKIKELWHLITYDEDLSDDKITRLGRLRHVFYLRDDSRKLLYASNHEGMNKYVRPMSKFISDIKSAQQN